MDKHTLAVFGGIVAALMVVSAVLLLIPGYGKTIETGLYDTGDKLLDKADIETFEMVVETPAHGIIEIKDKKLTQNNSYMVVAGETVNFSITPNNGYRYSRIVVKYENDSFTLYASDPCKFVVPKSDITIQVFFEPI